MSGQGSVTAARLSRLHLPMTLHEQLLGELEADPLAEHIDILGERAGLNPVRRAFAATRVVMATSYAEVPHTPSGPGSPSDIQPHVDWEATRASRRYLIEQGLGIAEAMDTAQRFQLGWPTAKRLIEETSTLSPPAGFIAGASSDHLAQIESAQALCEGVIHQVNFIQVAGGLPILLPMPWLVNRGCDEDEFVAVYDQILSAVEGPILIHWLGPAFLEGMQHYFPGSSFERVMSLDRNKVAGVKLSLLDPAFERRVRSELMRHGQAVFTGDDLNFPALVEGESQQVLSSREIVGGALTCGDFSHALLGILDAIARPATLALRALAAGDCARYDQLMAPCKELGAHLFGRPTWGYRAGMAHLAWLAGRQENAMLPNHEESVHDDPFKQRLTLLAVRAGVFDDRAAVRERLEVDRASAR